MTGEDSDGRRTGKHKKRRHRRMPVYTAFEVEIVYEMNKKTPKSKGFQHNGGALTLIKT